MIWPFAWIVSRKRDPATGIRNFGTLVEGQIYRGADGGTTEYLKLRSKLKIETVINLTAGDAEDEREVNRAGLQYLHLPMRDDEMPDEDTVRFWLEYARSGDRIFIHCKGGRHRTGLMIAIYRVVINGWSKEQAWREAEKFGWYSTWGHAPLKRWFFDEFQPEDYR